MFIAISGLKFTKTFNFKTYIEIVNLAHKNGFEYAYQIGVEKKDPTIRKQSAFTNTFMNEMGFHLLKFVQSFWDYHHITNSPTRSKHLPIQTCPYCPRAV